MNKEFNNQFATQKLLREAQGPFYVVYNRGYGQGKGIANDYKPFPSLEAAQAFADKMNDLGSGTFSKFQTNYYVIGSDHEDFEWVSQAAHDKAGLDKEIGEDTNIEETSATGTGASFTAGTGEQYATPKAFKKVKKEEKDVEPKLAAGPAKVYMKDKWGWKEAPSIPNRPSKGGFVYKQLFEALSKEANEAEWPSEVPSRYGEYIFKLVKVMPDGAMYDVIDVETGKKELGGRAYRSVETLKYAAADLVKPKGGTQSTQLNENVNIPQNIVNFAKKKGISAELNMIANWIEKAGKRIVGGTAIGKNYNTLILDLTHQGSEIYYNIDNESLEVNGQPVDSYEEFLEALTVVDGSLNENYSRFKKETKTRTNEQQLHAAMRLAEKKIHEANRILEYTSQLRSELNETKVNKNTQKLMEKITRGIAEAYGKMKKMK